MTKCKQQNIVSIFLKVSIFQNKKLWRKEKEKEGGRETVWEEVKYEVKEGKKKGGRK